MPNARRSKLVQLPLPLEIEEEILPEEVEEEIEVVSVVLCRHKIVNVTGKFSGRTYKFNGAGSIVDDVDIRDAEIMINQPLVQSCCGSTSTAQFQILGR